MEEPISTVIIADASELGAIGASFGVKYNIKLMLKTDNYDDARKALQPLKHPVAVIRVRDSRSAQVRAFSSWLCEKHIAFICICLNASEGFAMLQQGAADMFARTASELEDNPQSLEQLISTKIRVAYSKYFEDNSRPLKREFGGFNKIITVGSSTGGTETVFEILKLLPADIPPILIVQHMPPVFTKLYAERLHNTCKMSVWEAHDGDVLKRGLVLLAPGDFQMTLKSNNGIYRVACQKGDKENGHCPSVDVLFNSVAKVAGPKSIGVILTGMGRDGAKGLLAMRKNGAMTLGQDEASCVVYGMPKEAYDIGAVVRQVSALDMARTILEYV